MTFSIFFRVCDQSSIKSIGRIINARTVKTLAVVGQRETRRRSDEHLPKDWARIINQGEKTMNSKNQKNFVSRKGRLIVVNGVNWKWRVGKHGGVTAHSEFGDRMYAHADKITGRDFFRGQWKRSDGVYPSDIAAWISLTMYNSVV